MSVEEARAHAGLIQKTTVKLATRLAHTEDKFEALYAEGAKELQHKPSKLRQVEIEKSITLACVRVCQHVSERIKKILSALEEETKSLRPESTELHMHSGFKYSKIENTGCGDTFQAMFTTGEVLHGTNRGKGWLTRQGGGIMKDDTMKHVMTLLASTIPRNQGHDLQEQGRSYSSPRSAISIDQASRFEEIYGRGKTSGPDFAQ